MKSHSSSSNSGSDRFASFGSVSSGSGAGSGRASSASSAGNSNNSNSSLSHSSGSSTNFSFGSFSNSGSLDPNVTPDAVPETPANMANRPYALLDMSFMDAKNPNSTREYQVNSAGTGAVEFINSKKQYVPNARVIVTEGQTFQLQLFGKTVSGQKLGTLIEIRLVKKDKNGKPIVNNKPDKVESITVWKVVVKNAGNPITPGVPANEHGYVYISGTPAMPVLSASLLPSGLIGPVSWTLRMQYNRPNRTDDDVIPPATSPPIFVDAGSVWNINFGGNFYGGTFSMKATYQYQSTTLASDNFVFYVRARNEGIGQINIANYIDSVIPYLYAKAIAKLESNPFGHEGPYVQFNDVGKLGAEPEESKYCPNLGGDNAKGDYGWGIYQLTDPPATTTQLWNWKANIDAAAAIMKPYYKYAQDWISSQIKLQKAQDINNERPLENEVFTWGYGVEFKEGNKYTPVDAVAILFYNAGPNVHAIYWEKNANNGKGDWLKRDDNRKYLYQVSKFLQ